MSLTRDIANAFKESAGLPKNSANDNIDTLAENLAIAFKDFLVSQTFTITELKASVELEEFSTSAPLNLQVATNVEVGNITGQPTPTGGGITPGTGQGRGTGEGFVESRLNLKKSGGVHPEISTKTHGGHMEAIGHAYVGNKDKVPNSDTREEWNDFTKVKLSPENVRNL